MVLLHKKKPSELVRRLVLSFIPSVSVQHQDPSGMWNIETIYRKEVNKILNRHHKQTVAHGKS